MAILTFDTSSINCAVHIRRDDGVFHEETAGIGRGHAEILIEMIERGLAVLDIRFKDLTKIGVTTGPGSFTGVRVGLSAARGYGLALDIPVVGISALAAFAREAPAGQPVLVVLDAGRGGFYAEFFGEDTKTCGGPFLYDTGDKVPSLWISSSALSLIGPGAAHFAEILPSSTIISTAPAAKIATIAALVHQTNDPAPPVPLYLRPPDAKPQNPASLIARLAP